MIIRVDENNSKVVKIGEIIFDDSLEETGSVETGQNLPDLKGIGKCDIYIGGNEGDFIPHFHIKSFSKDNNKKFDGCVYIFENKWFAHGSHKDQFYDSKRCKQLNEWMSKENILIKYLNINCTNWQAIRYFWNTTNGTKYMNSDEVVVTDYQPNYSTMMPYK